MQYYKIVNEETVTSLGTINADGNGNITESEYTELLSMIRQMPGGKQIHDNGDGTYSYVDAPEPPEGEPTPEEIIEILTGEIE